MVLDLVTVLPGDLSLNLLDSLVEKLDHFTGIETHHVIVVITIRELEDGRAALEVVPRDEPRALELREDTVHGRKPELLTGFEQRAINRFRGQMALFALLEDLQDLEPRRSDLQSDVAKILPFHCLLPYIKWGMIRGSIMAHTRLALHRPAEARRTRAAQTRAALAVLCAALAVFAAGGCAYRMNVQQGNIVEMDDLNQVREGMTRSQVQFLLGTPLVSDPFHADRWDYTYFFRQGRKRNVSRHWVTIHFEDDRVARIETRIAPTGAPSIDVPSPDDIDEDTIPPSELDTDVASTGR